MKGSKIPKSIRYGLRFYRTRAVKRFLKWSFWTAFLAGHLLIVYRQPVKFVIVFLYERYWFTQTVLVPILFILLSIVATITLSLWKRRHRYSIRWHLMWQVVSGMLLPICFIYYGMHLWFHLIRVSIKDSGYLESEFMVLGSFIIIWNLVLLLGLQFREDRRKQRRLERSFRIINHKRAKRLAIEFGEITERAFIILTEKNSVYEISVQGSVEPLTLEDEKLEELLGYAYVQVNRWTYIHLESIISIDGIDKVVYLSKERDEVWKSIPTDMGFYKNFKDKIKGENGLLTISKTYEKTAKAKWEEYKRVQGL